MIFNSWIAERNINMLANKSEEKFRCSKCSGYLNGSISSRKISTGGRVMYYECRGCEIKFRSVNDGPIEPVSVPENTFKGLFKCPCCDNRLTGCISVKVLKDGRKSRYFDCESCGRRYRNTDGEGLSESKPKKGFNEHTSKLKAAIGLIPGARVFVDGKFVGVAK